MRITSENSVVSYPNSGEASIHYIPTPLTGYQALMGFQRHLLEDAVRTETFIQAIERVVEPDEVGVDLGSGTGILALACARTGAKKVYAIETEPLIWTARRVAEVNGLAERIEFIQQNSRQVTLPEKVDFVVSECLGLMGIGGTMMPDVVDIARRCLKEGGRIIPQAVSLFLAPVESRLHFDYVHVWEQRQFYGFDWSPFQPIAGNNAYIARFKPEHFVAEPQRVATLRLLTDDVSRLETTVRFSPTRAGRLHGYCGWFEADLGGGVSLSASPLAAPTIWKQVYLPLEQEVPLNKDSRIEVEFGLIPEKLSGAIPGHFRWNTKVIETGQTISFKQSTLKSMPKKVLPTTDG
jgi:SAM-dependent methyltransferase